MHYKNGREARPGDLVFHMPAFGAPACGVVHSLNVQTSTCNARLTVPSPNDAYVNLSDCLHADDVAAAFAAAPEPAPLPVAAEPKAKAAS